MAERRRAHVIELRESGRWKHYYTAEELLEALREAVTMRDAWAKIAGLQPDEASQADDEGDEAHDFRDAASRKNRGYEARLGGDTPDGIADVVRDKERAGRSIATPTGRP